MSTTRLSFLRRRQAATVLGALIAIIVHQRAPAGDSTWAYAVEVAASVQGSPPGITLSWRDDFYGVNSFTIFRKSRDSTSWGTPLANLPGSSLSYTDTNVTVGVPYEYQIVKHATLGYTGYGYIYSGIEVPLTEARGKLLLIIATNNTVSLSNELSRLRSDLVGDGWTVVRHDVSSAYS